MKRFYTRGVVLGSAVLVILLGIMAFCQWFELRNPWIGWIGLGVIATGLGFVVVKACSFETRLYKHVWAMDFMVCLTCGHSLQGLHSNIEHQQCPECGQSVDLKEVKTTWLTVMGHLDADGSTRR
jgi:predicted RNA-binding Zn-ribbon protein involved in translation (DUF1610 family)